MQTEILVVGAGPAGAAAAVQLGQLGIRGALLVDRDRFPRNKTCGSGLSPAALQLAHNGTGEGISQAMQSGIFAAEAVARVVRGQATEAASWRQYRRALRRRFTASFVAGHVLRDIVDSTLLDRLARTYNSASFQQSIHWLMGAALTGSTSQEAPPAYVQPRSERLDLAEPGPG